MLSSKERLESFLNLNPVIAKKSLGQNFLVSDQAIKKMIQTVLEFNPDNIIEIGPGPGALTDYLILLKKKLILLELDDEFFQYWKNKNQDCRHVDAVTWDWESVSLEAQKFVLISNLPYQISSTIVVDRSMDKSKFKGMILMFQKEVAQKIKARSGGSEFGFLSLIAQTFWQIEILCDLGPRDFKPAPKVSSRVLVFRPKEEIPIKNPSGYLKFVKAGFSQKRKLLKKNLMSMGHLNSDKLLESFRRCELNENLRAEELSVEKWIQLYIDLGFE